VATKTSEFLLFYVLLFTIFDSLAGLPFNLEIIERGLLSPIVVRKDVRRQAKIKDRLKDSTSPC
jgi:hypothetical protein